MLYWLRSPQVADVVIVVVITAATLTHGYASDICKSFGCIDTIQHFEAATMTGMVGASGVLLFRAFIYRDVDRSKVRNLATFVVVCTASAHTICHNLWQWLPDVYSPLLFIPTLFLLTLVGRMLTNPRKTWPAGAEVKAADRNYYETMIDDWTFVYAYWIFITAGLWLVWVMDVAGWLFEPEPLTMLVVGLFGPLIALYFANRERSRRIEENMFYKMMTLAHTSAIILIAMARVRQQLADCTKNTGADLRMTGRIEDETHLWKDERIHIHATNTNRHVPAYVRAMMSGIILISDAVFLRNNSTTEPDVGMNHLLGELGRLIDFAYFKDDRDPNVRKLWRQVKDDLHNAEELVAKP